MRKLLMASIALGCLTLTGCAGMSVAFSAGEDNVEKLRAQIAAGADINAKYQGSPPLTWAAARGNLESVRILLDAKADPNLKTTMTEKTPLWAAVKMGHTDVARLLLKRGATVTPMAMLEARQAGGAMLQLLSAARQGYLPSEAALAASPEARRTQKPSMFVEPPPTALSGAPPQPAAGALPPAEPIKRLSDVDFVRFPRRAPLKKAYALVLGVESYRENLPKADYAASDAKLVGEYLTALGYPQENVVVRTDDKASLTDFIKYVEGWLPNNVEKDAKVFVYFSGHGAPNPKTGTAYLVPYDGDPTFIESTGYPVERLYAALDKLPTDDVSVVLDSCFSGAGGRSVLAKGARPLVQVVSVAQGTRATVLSAGASDQISNAYAEKGHGLLTYFLLKALGGEGDLNKDGTVTLAEAHAYALPNVQSIARKLYNNEQTPQFTTGGRR